MRICKPYFSNKYVRGDTNLIVTAKMNLFSIISLIWKLPKNELIPNNFNNIKTAITFNDYFAKIVPSLKLFKQESYVFSQ